MNIFNSYRNGIKTTNNNFSIILKLWIFNFVFALILIYPIFSFFKEEFGSSLVGADILQRFDLLWLGDLGVKIIELNSLFSSMFLLPLILYFILNIFLNGGILGSIIHEDANDRSPKFWFYCGNYFWPFFRLFMVSLVGYGIFIGLPMLIVGKITGIFTSDPATEWPVFISSLTKHIIFILVFSFANMTFDYAKIRIVSESSKGVLKAVWFSVKFVFKNIFSTWGLYLLIMTSFVLISILYMEIEDFLPAGFAFMIVVVFILQQLYILSRIWFRLTFFSSQYELYKLRVLF